MLEYRKRSKLVEGVQKYILQYIFNWWEPVDKENSNFEEEKSKIRCL